MGPNGLGRCLDRMTGHGVTCQSALARAIIRIGSIEYRGTAPKINFGYLPAALAC